MTNPWDKIFLEDFEGALKIANENIALTNSKFDLRARALIKLQQGDYSESLKDFTRLNKYEQESSSISDDTYLYLGLCHYALGDSDQAIRHFEYPVKNNKEFKYSTDITLAPAILYFISLTTGNVTTLSLAEKDLNKRKTPIGEFLMGRISEHAFESAFILTELKIRRQCSAEFYKSVKSLKEMDYDKQYKHLKKAVELKGQFLEFEYYLSKVEMEKIAVRD